LFSKGKSHHKSITAALKDHHKTFTYKDISDILFTSSKNHYSLSTEQLQYIVAAIHQQRGGINNISISKFFYGLKLQSSDNETMLSLLRAVHPVITCPTRKLPSFNGQAISAMVYGFQRMSSKHEEIRNMISFFTSAIDSCGEVLTAQSMSSLFYGMQQFDPAHAEVRRGSFIIVASFK
jgi:hypothetical protein